jgi:hypothetical protein
MLNVSQKGSVFEVDHPASDDWIMPHADIKEAEQFGIRLRGGGTHQSKTMMLAEISAYWGSSGMDSSRARSLIVDANVLDKRTVSSRLLTFRHLNALYAIETMPAITKTLASLWKSDGKGRPLLATVLEVRCTARFCPAYVGSGSSATRRALSTLAKCPLCLQYRPN